MCFFMLEIPRSWLVVFFSRFIRADLLGLRPIFYGSDLLCLTVRGRAGYRGQRRLRAMPQLKNSAWLQALRAKLRQAMEAYGRV